MQSVHAGTKLLIVVLHICYADWNRCDKFPTNDINHSRSQRTQLLKLAFWSRFFPYDEYMRDEYLIRNTHRTFRAWLLPFSFVGGQP